MAELKLKDLELISLYAEDEGEMGDVESEENEDEGEGDGGEPEEE
jgi:hypothetical protein